VYITNLLQHVYNTVPLDVVMTRWWQKLNRCQKSCTPKSKGQWHSGRHCRKDIP